MGKGWQILLNAVPILLMIGLIPLIANDYFLAVFYILIIIVSLSMHREKNDVAIFLFGFCIMIACEYLFVSTGVEIFDRNTLFGVMPLWLPFLWGYGFIAIKRAIEIIER